MEREIVIDVELTVRERAAVVESFRYARVQGDESHLRFNALWDALIGEDGELPGHTVLPAGFGSKSKIALSAWDLELLRGMLSGGAMPGPLARALRDLHRQLLLVPSELEKRTAEPAADEAAIV